MIAAQLAEQLRRAGFRIGAVSEPEASVDGSIDVSDRVHVQVGFEYHNVVVRESDNCFQFYPIRPSLAPLVRDLREALAATGHSESALGVIESR